MEFFEFDNSFIGGYGDKQTSLTSGDTLVDVKVKGNSDDYKTTCNMVQNFKDNNTLIDNGRTCIDSLPYTKNNKGGMTKLEPVTSTRKFR